jgi:hypothetical protein
LFYSYVTVKLGAPIFFLLTTPPNFGALKQPTAINAPSTPTKKKVQFQSEHDRCAAERKKQLLICM